MVSNSGDSAQQVYILSLQVENSDEKSSDINGECQVFVLLEGQENNEVTPDKPQTGNATADINVNHIGEPHRSSTPADKLE